MKNQLTCQVETAAAWSRFQRCECARAIRIRMIVAAGIMVAVTILDWGLLP